MFDITKQTFCDKETLLKTIRHVIKNKRFGQILPYERYVGLIIGSNKEKKNGCYILYDANEQIVYVGSSSNIYRRCRESANRCKKQHDTKIEYMSICFCDSTQIAIALETSIIALLEPSYNIYCTANHIEHTKRGLQRTVMENGTKLGRPKTDQTLIRKAIELRTLGHTFSKIGSIMGISRARAHQLVNTNIEMNGVK